MAFPAIFLEKQLEHLSKLFECKDKNATPFSKIFT